MKKYLFLDDERNPGDVTWINIGHVGAQNINWQVVRSNKEAQDWVIKNGFPDVISFDHDLGEAHYSMDYSDEQTGYDFAKWLIEFDMDTKSMPENFIYTVHSMNPIGAKNIKSLLDNYIKQK